eukprot:442158-Rhodomonas_salina.1
MGSGLDDQGKQKLVDIAVSEDMSHLTQPRHVEVQPVAGGPASTPRERAAEALKARGQLRKKPPGSRDSKKGGGKN